MGRNRKRKVKEGGNEGGTPAPPPTRRSTKRTRGNNDSGEDHDQADAQDPAGGGGPSGPTVKLNPLLIDLVLANLFDYLDRGSLSSARRVCRLWRDISLPVWRSSGATLMLNNRWDPRLRSFTTELEKFLGFWDEQCRDSPHPYRQFCLDGWEFQDWVDLADLDEVHFWQVVGGSIKKLTLVNCTAIRSNSFFNMMNQSCPNLETLILDHCALSDTDSYLARVEREAASRYQYEPPAFGEHPNLKSLTVIKTGGMGMMRTDLQITCLELLSHFPHLTSFQGIPNERKPYDNDLEILRAVTRVREQDGRNLPLKQLGLKNPVDVGRIGAALVGPNQMERREILGLAHSLNIPLTSIRLDQNLADGDANEIKRIVQLNGPALVTLIAGIECSPPCIGFPFGVRLENLKELKISDGLCFSLKFLKFTPNLETLRIVDCVTTPGPNSERKHGRATTLLTNTPIQELEDVRLLKLTTFQLQYMVSEEGVRHLVRWLPNVTNLEMFLEDSQFAVVCQAWKKLARLKVYGDALTDRGLIGFRRNSRSLAIMLGKGELVASNISQLSCLEVFDAPNSTLTDVSVTHGLIKICPVLRHVFIRNTQITDAAKMTLHESYVKIDFGFVDPNSNGNDDDQ